MKDTAHEKMRPMNQARIVEQGMSGSSWLSTTARTSAYGELCVIKAASIFISWMSVWCFSGCFKISS